MDVKLDNEVVFAILAAIVAIVFILNLTRVLRMRMAPRMAFEKGTVPYDHENAATQTWPTSQ